MKINVLGTPYELVTANLPEDRDGECDRFRKVMTVRPDSELDGDAETKPEYRRAIIRHEIVHAFLFESGLSEYGCDEALVEWVALKMPQMVEAMQKAKAL